jgi:transposase
MSTLAQTIPSAETKPPRRLHSVEKKRRIVEETLRPHASVARVAQAHGVNANQVFYWRKQYQQGLLGPVPPKAALLPVQVSDLVLPEPVSAPVVPREALVSSQPGVDLAPTGAIHLELAKAKLCVQGAADLSCLRAVLDRLLG